MGFCKIQNMCKLFSDSNWSLSITKEMLSKRATSPPPLRCRNRAVRESSPWLPSPLSLEEQEASWTSHLLQRSMKVWDKHMDIHKTTNTRYQRPKNKKFNKKKTKKKTDSCLTFLSNTAKAASAALEAFFSSAPLLRTGDGARTQSFCRFWILAQRSMSFMIWKKWNMETNIYIYILKIV